MLKRYAQGQMDHATNEIRQLIARQDILSLREEDRLKRLDRSYKFWKQFA